MEETTAVIHREGGGKKAAYTCRKENIISTISTRQESKTALKLEKEKSWGVGVAGWREHIICQIGHTTQENG